MAIQLQIRELGRGFNTDGTYRAEWKTVDETRYHKATKDMLSCAREYRRENSHEVRFVDTRAAPEMAL